MTVNLDASTKKQTLPLNRKSANNAQLWQRRIKAVRMHAVKIPLADIAHELGVSVTTLQKDFKAFAIMRDIVKKSGLNDEIETLEEMIRRAANEFSKTTSDQSKIGYMKNIIDSVKEISILKGVRKADGEQTFNFGDGLERAALRFSEIKK